MIPFVGPSYGLVNRKASAQRSVNLYLVALETASKSQFILKSVPGLTVLNLLEPPTRAVLVAAGRMFVVAGDTLYEVYSDGTSYGRGTLATTTGRVSMTRGMAQVLIVDGLHGYVLTLATNAFAQITDPDFPGATTCGYLGGFYILTRGTSQEAYVTAIEDASDIDALDYASAESSPDNIVTHIVSHQEVVYLGETSTERWFNAGGADYPFARDNAAMTEVGCIAEGSAASVDNSIIWLGRDERGAGMVYRDIDRQPARISTLAVEEALQASTDMTVAIAYTYQMDGQTFYCLNAPGVKSTWCYEIGSGQWHERCDLDADGHFKALRVTHTAYAFGKQFAFDGDGKVYQMDAAVNNFAGDVMKRTRISPNYAVPMLDRQYYNEFVLDCSTGLAPQGETPVVELSWSDDGGYQWGNPVQRSFGSVGQYKERVQWQRLGFARDRVWRIDCTDDAPFSIISGAVR